MNIRSLSSRLVAASLALGILLLPACILVLDGDGHWDGRWHDGRHHDSIRGSGVSKTESRTIGDFHAVQVNGSADVSVAVGSAASLSVTGDDNLLPYVVTEVREGTLVVEMKPGSYSPRVDLKIVATVPALDAGSVSGSGDLALTGIAGDKLKIRISGSGDARASGKVKDLSAGVSGSGDLRLGDLESADAEVEISGSGDVDVWATESLAASIAGSGDVTYKGDPKKVTKSVAGSGGVRKR